MDNEETRMKLTQEELEERNDLRRGDIVKVPIYENEGGGKVSLVVHRFQVLYLNETGALTLHLGKRFSYRQFLTWWQINKARGRIKCIPTSEMDDRRYEYCIRNRKKRK